jgi:ATP-binding cassette subfamily F protein uup
MPIVTLNNLSLAFGTDQILDRAELSIEAGERIAVTGRNGAGKSTLLRLICGDITEDDGNLWRADNQNFVTLAQDLPERTNQSVFDAVASVFEDVGDKLGQYHILTHNMTGTDAENKQLAELQEALDHADGWNLNHRIEVTLNRLTRQGPSASIVRLISTVCMGCLPMFVVRMLLIAPIHP